MLRTRYRRYSDDEKVQKKRTKGCILLYAKVLRALLQIMTVQDCVFDQLAVKN